VFSLIAEYLGINVQLSRYTIFSETRKAPSLNSKYQLVIEYIEPCRNDFKEKFGAFEQAYEDKEDSLTSLNECGHIDAIDIVKVGMLSYIFGANDDSECFLAEDGRIYTIDNEQMFSTPPVELASCEWFDKNEALANEIAIDLCSKLALLSDSDIELFTSVPRGYKVNEIWRVKPLVNEARDSARMFMECHA